MMRPYAYDNTFPDKVVHTANLIQNKPQYSDDYVIRSDSTRLLRDMGTSALRDVNMLITGITFTELQ